MRGFEPEERALGRKRSRMTFRAFDSLAEISTTISPNGELGHFNQSWK